MTETGRPAAGGHSPSLDDLAFEGEATPLLLRKGVVAGVVAGFLLIVAAYFAVSLYFGVSTEIDAKPFREWVERRGALGPVVFVLVMALSVLFAPIPNAPIFIAAGLVWGTVLGTVYSVSGLLLGSVMAFHVSRTVGRRHLPRLVGSRLAARVDALADTMGGRVIFWSRMLPVVNFDWVSFIAGVTAIRFRTFFFYSLLGMLLPTFVTVSAGDGLGRDFRVTLLMGGLWMLGIVASALYFWRRQRRWNAARAIAPATTGD